MEEHNSIEASQLSEFVYTLTDTSKTYEFEPFITDLDWCQVSYTYSIESLGESDNLITFDSRALTFSAFNDNDLTLCGYE